MTAVVRLDYRWVAALCAAATLAACGPKDRPSNPTLQPGAFRGSNVLLVTIDTLRADRVGAFGGGRLTPSIDRLAAGGVRFIRAYAHVPMTLPAHTSIMTGLFPVHHGVHTNGSGGLDAGPRTLAELFRQAGYRTGAFVGSFVLDARFGLNRGFDTYDDRVGTERGPVTFGFVERSAERVASAATEWIRSGDRPWFAWVHFFDPHAPYRAPRALVNDPYDNEVAYTDEVLGTIIAALGQSGELSRTLVIVTADHGESLGEHGEETHGLFAYEPTLRIPLVLAGPALNPATVVEPVGQADLLPTIAELAGIPVPTGIDGRSLLAAMRGDRSYLVERAIAIEALDANLSRNWAPLRGVVSGRWKYIDLPIPELYDLADDPREERNVASVQPARAAALGRLLQPFTSPASSAGSAREIDPDAAARLRSLGYTTPTPGSVGANRRYTENDDPKRLVDVDREYQRALHLTGEGQHAEAIAAFRGTIARRPDFTASYLTLASVLIEDGRPADAIQVLLDARSRGLSDPKLQERMGAAHLAMGDRQKAAQVLEPMVDTGSVDALNTLAIAYAETGRLDRARSLLQRALARAPAAASIWNNLGLLELSAGRPADAAHAFERSTTADPDFAPAWTGLGASRARSDAPGAIVAWQHAVALAPGDYDTLFNLGMLLWQTGRRDEAANVLNRFITQAPAPQYAADIDRVRRLLSSK